jgi:hypothetical protein
LLCLEKERGTLSMMLTTGQGEGTQTALVLRGGIGATGKEELEGGRDGGTEGGREGGREEGQE